jgi:hypothetical protein
LFPLLGHTRDKGLGVAVFFMPIYRVSNIDHGRIETSSTRDKKEENAAKEDALYRKQVYNSF